MASTTAASRIQNGATPSANAAGDGAKRTKPHATGQKLMVRHLPPLITQEEIQAILGEEWKTGNGKVGWAEFQRGKVPKRYTIFPRCFGVRIQ